MKKVSLPFNWTLKVHPTCKVFSQCDEQTNTFLVLDWDNDIIFNFEVAESNFKSFQSNWNAKFSFDIVSKTIVIENEPEDEE